MVAWQGDIKTKQKKYWFNFKFVDKTGLWLISRVRFDKTGWYSPGSNPISTTYFVSGLLHLGII